MLRRVLIIGLLPLSQQPTIVNIGVAIAFTIVSLVIYRETKPFLEERNNLLVVVAQYCSLITFSFAFALEVNVFSHQNNSVAGYALVFVNIFVIILAICNLTYRVRRLDIERQLEEVSKNTTVESAHAFSPADFDRDMEMVRAKKNLETHTIVFWYCTIDEMASALCQGIPATREQDGGIIFTLNGPKLCDEFDELFFRLRPPPEAAIVCALPKTMLTLLSGAELRTSSLRMLSGSLMRSLRGVDLISSSRNARAGGVFLPPKSIVRIYKIVEIGDDATISRPLGSAAKQSSVGDLGESVSRSPTMFLKASIMSPL